MSMFAHHFQCKSRFRIAIIKVPLVANNAKNIKALPINDSKRFTTEALNFEIIIRSLKYQKLQTAVCQFICVKSIHV